MPHLTQSILFSYQSWSCWYTTSLQGSEGGLIATLEVHELLTKIHDILENALCKWVSKTMHILAYLFNSASWQCHEVWAFSQCSYTLFLIVMLACMVASTSLWHRLTNSHHLDLPSIQPLWGVPGLSQKLDSCLMYRSDLCWCQVVPSWCRSLICILGLKVIRVAGSQVRVLLPVPLTLRGRGHGNSVPDVIHSTVLSPSLSFLVQIGTLPKILY